MGVGGRDRGEVGGDVPLNIMFYILKSGADFTLRNEVRIRGGEGVGTGTGEEGGAETLNIMFYILKSEADLL